MRNRAWFEVNGVQNQKITDSHHLLLQQVAGTTGSTKLTILEHKEGGVQGQNY